MTHDDSILGGEKEREENLIEILQSLFTVSCRVGSVCPCSLCLSKAVHGYPPLCSSTGAAGTGVSGS